MNRKVYFIIGIAGCAFVLILFAYGLFFASDPNSIPSALIEQPAASMKLTTFDGEEITLEQFKGRPIVLNFWASWCISCRIEAHILEQAYQKYRSKGAVFVGVAINDEREAALRFMRKYGKTYLLGMDDKIGNISLDYGITAVPETFFIDGKGIIKEKILGPADKLSIETFLNTQLNLNQASSSI